MRFCEREREVVWVGSDSGAGWVGCCGGWGWSMDWERKTAKIITKKMFTVGYLG